MSRGSSFIDSRKSCGNCINRKWEIYMQEMSFIQREGQSWQSLSVWLCQAALSRSMSHAEPSLQFCYNIKTIAAQWKNTSPPSHPNNITATGRHTQTHTPAPALTCIHSIQFSLLSSTKQSCSQLIEANKCMVSFSFKRNKLSGFPLDEVMSILV